MGNSISLYRLRKIMICFAPVILMLVIAKSNVYAEPNISNVKVELSKNSYVSGITAECTLSFRAYDEVSPLRAEVIYSAEYSLGNISFTTCDFAKNNITDRISSRISIMASNVPSDYDLSGINIYYDYNGEEQKEYISADSVTGDKILKITPKALNMEITGVATDVSCDGTTMHTGDVYNCSITVKNNFQTLPITITSIKYDQEMFYGGVLNEMTKRSVNKNIEIQPKESKTIPINVPVRMNPDSREETTPEKYQVTYMYYLNDGTKRIGHTTIESVTMIGSFTGFRQSNLEESEYDTLGYGNVLTGPVYYYIVPNITKASCKLAVTSTTYTGKEIKPAVTVKDAKGTVVDPSAYTVAYSNNINPGTATVKINFPYTDSDGKANKYTISKTFKINPKATTLSSLTPAADGITVKWNKVGGGVGYKIYRSVNGGSYSCVKTISANATTSWKDTGAKANGKKYSYKIKCYKNSDTSAYSASKTTYFLTRPTVTLSAGTKAFTAKWGKNDKASGYEIQYSTSSTFASGNKTVTATSYKTVSKTVKSLKAKKKYYVRVRAHKTVNKVKHYSVWSAKKYIITK